MYKEGKYLIYGKDVCKITKIEKQKYNNEDYYILEPIKDKTLKIQVPVSYSNFKELISEEDLNNLINKMPNIELIDIDEKYLENEYKKLLSTGNEKDLLKVMKTTYTRKKKRSDNNKRVNEKDNIYLKKAEDYIFTLVSVIKNISLDEAKLYFIKKVKEAYN